MALWRSAVRPRYAPPFFKKDVSPGRPRRSANALTPFLGQAQLLRPIILKADCADTFRASETSELLGRVETFHF